MCACGEHACDARTRGGWHLGALPASVRACVRQAARARSRRHRFDYQPLAAPRPAEEGTRDGFVRGAGFGGADERLSVARCGADFDATTDELERTVPSATLLVARACLHQLHRVAGAVREAVRAASNTADVRCNIVYWLDSSIVLGTCRCIGNIVNPVTADPVKALHFAVILV